MHLWIPYQRGKFNWRNLVGFAATGLVLGFLRMVRLVGNVIYWCWVGFHFISDHFVVGWNDFDFPILAKKSGKSYARIPKLEVQDEQHCHCCTRQATHPCSVSEGSRTHASPPVWAEWANIPSGKMEPAWACSTIRRTTNISQNWAKVLLR